LSRLRPPGFGEPTPDPSGFGAQDSLALLRLLQLFDSQFPVGAFAHSGGIETYAALGGSLPELREVLLAQIDLGWGRSELAGAFLAWDAAGRQSADADLARLASLMDALKVVPSVRQASLGLGRRTLDLLARTYPETAVAISPPHHAVIVGAAGRRLGIGSRELLLAFAQNLAGGTLAAAVRCMPVSAAQTQRLLTDSHERLIAAVDRAMDDPEGCLFTATPALDIRSHQQQHLHTRLFQS
jgi:urease accessory protein